MNRAIVFEGYKGIHAVYDLTDVKAVYIGSNEGRLGVCLDYANRQQFVHIDGIEYELHLDHVVELQMLLHEIVGVLAMEEDGFYYLS